MSGRSGETARRAALGIGLARHGGQVAQALQTIRYSVLDKRRPKPTQADDARLVAKRRDKGHLLATLLMESRRLQRQLGEVKARLEKRGPPTWLLVSDHALIRFLERAMGIDVEAIRAQISRLVPSDRFEEERTLYIRNGLQFLVHRNRLVTVLDEYMDGYVADAFSIDDARIAEGPIPEPNARRDAASRAGRALSHRARGQRAKFEETTARLRAELGR